MTCLAVLGGGQLGRMLALAAVPLGVEVRALDPVAGAPAGAVSALTVASLDDVGAMQTMADGATAVTYEWEGVPADAVETLVAAGHTVHPASAALRVSQDRLAEKTTFERLGIPVAPFADVASRADLDAAAHAVGLPAILKTRRGGYDGKGQYSIASSVDLHAAWSELGQGAPLVLESRIAFERELSIIAVRGHDGDVRTWPLVENDHRDGILRTSRVPANGVTPSLQATADRYVATLLTEFKYVGVLTLELFCIDSTLLANEMAPRVHNSGHWTIEGADTSQFENHVRAVLGFPLGSTALRAPSVMINCIGVLPDPTRVLAVPGTHVHAYGKAPRPGRKVGHVTVTADDEPTLAERVAAVRALLPVDIG